MTADEVRQYEDELVARAAAGDRRAFSELVRHHQDEVYTLAVRLTGDRELGADVAQEAFVRAYQRWWRVGHLRNPAAWVQRVALNYRIDIERKNTRECQVIQPVEVEVLDEAESDPGVESAVRTLPPQQQAAVRAVYGNGMSTEETADDLGISAGAVRYHLSKARTALRPLLSSNTARQEA